MTNPPVTPDSTPDSQTAFLARLLDTFRVARDQVEALDDDQRRTSIHAARYQQAVDAANRQSNSHQSFADALTPTEQVAAPRHRWLSAFVGAYRTADAHRFQSLRGQPVGGGWDGDSNPTFAAAVATAGQFSVDGVSDQTGTRHSDLDNPPADWLRVFNLAFGIAQSAFPDVHNVVRLAGWIAAHRGDRLALAAVRNRQLTDDSFCKMWNEALDIAAANSDAAAQPADLRHVLASLVDAADQAVTAYRTSAIAGTVRRDHDVLGGYLRAVYHAARAAQLIYRADNPER